MWEAEHNYNYNIAHVLTTSARWNLNEGKNRKDKHENTKRFENKEHNMYVWIPYKLIRTSDPDY